MYQVDDYTVSLLHFDEEIKDETGKVWTSSGSPTISATQSKFGGKSLYLDGSSYLSTSSVDDFNFGTSDFTIDWWEYRANNSSKSPVYTRNNSVLGGSLLVGQYSGGNIVYYMSSDGASWNIANRVTMGTVILNVWTHYALVRKGNSIMAFQNGVLQSTITSSSSILKGVSTPFIGYDGGNYYTGYIDEFRISNVARWTEDFDPTASVTVPTNLTATAGDSQVTLSWTAVAGATSYIVKRSTTSGGTYETIASGATDTSYVDTNAKNGTTYYYIVTAVTADGESANSNEASATPMASSKSLLRITMNDSSEREYRLTSTEINSFINWYTRTVGTGTTSYTFNDTIDNSKEYLSFEKIISFKVIPTVE